MALLDGGLARLFGAALRSVYLPATLHRVTRTRARGGSTSESIVEVPCRAQVELADEHMRSAAGATTGDVRILVLAASLTGTITSDDRISVAGQLYAIAGVERDPANAIFELRGQRG
jgi:hypothetical protein